MGADEDFLGRMGPQLQLVLPMLDERSRRLVLGMAALAAGEGGTGRVAALAGASWQTVADGAAEVASGETAAAGRVRRPGGGRKPLAESDPGLLPALLALVQDSTRGDPESPLQWTSKSTRHLSDELAAQGHRCSPQTCWRMLMAAGVHHAVATPRPPRGGSTRTGTPSSGTSAAQASGHLAAGQPVISVDAKKKEQVGNYAQGGPGVAARGRARCGSATTRLPRTGTAGTRSPTGSTTWPRTPASSTSAPTTTPPRSPWSRSAAGGGLAGKAAYPGATRLLVTCDAGGSNGHRNRAGRRAWPRWPPETGPGDHRAATSRPAPPSGTRSSTGCSPRSPSAGAAAP